MEGNRAVSRASILIDIRPRIKLALGEINGHLASGLLNSIYVVVSTSGPTGDADTLRAGLPPENMKQTMHILNSRCPFDKQSPLLIWPLNLMGCQICKAGIHIRSALIWRNLPQITISSV